MCTYFSGNLDLFWPPYIPIGGYNILSSSKIIFSSGGISLHKVRDAEQLFWVVLFLKYLFSPLPNPRRSNSNLRIKKSKNRSKFKFHVYEPSVKRKENYNNQNNKNVIQNYENRLKQQQTLLLEVSFTNAAIPPTLQPTQFVQSVRNSGVTF